MSWLVERMLAAGVLAPMHLEGAQRRSLIYGGSIDTNLLEIQAVSPRLLHSLLSFASQAPPALPEHLLPQPRPVELMPLPLRDDPELTPLIASGGRLEVLVHPHAWDGHAQTLAQRYPAISFVTAAECMFMQVAAQSRGRTIGRRYVELAERYLENLLDKSLSAPLSRHTQPSTFALLTEELWHALFAVYPRHINELAVALQRVIQHFCERVAVFAATSDGLHALESSPALESVRGHDLPYSRILVQALSGERYIERCEDLDLRLAVGQEHSVPCVFAPVVVGRLTVLMVYADRSGQPFSDDELEIMHDLCGRAGELLFESLEHASQIEVYDAPDYAAAWEFLRTLGVQGQSSQRHVAAPTLVLPEPATLAPRVPLAQLAGVEFFGPRSTSSAREARIDVQRELDGTLNVDPPLRHDEHVVVQWLKQLDDPQIEGRKAAVYAFQEIRDPRCVWPLAKLGFDPDPEIRTLSMQVLETYRTSENFPHAVAEVRRGLWAKASRNREYAVRAAGILRDTLAVPRLIEELAGTDLPVRDAALQALCSITAQQLGLRVDRWRSWYHEHGQEGRASWLQAALHQPLEQVRHWASEEIARIAELAPSEDDSPTQVMNRAALGLANIALDNPDPGTPIRPPAPIGS